MAFQIDGPGVVFDDEQNKYQADPEFERVLDSLPNDVVPESLVVVGILTEQLHPYNGHIEDQIRLVSGAEYEVPPASIPSTTVKALIWLLSQVKDSLDEERKERIGTVVETAGLNSPSVDETTQTCREEVTGSKRIDRDDGSLPRTFSELTVTETRDDTEGGTVDCEFCGDTFESEDSLSSHWPHCDDRSQVDHFECSSCGKKFLAERALDRHFENCSEATESSKATCKQGMSSATDQKREYECKVCGEQFESRHRRVEHEFSCSSSRSDKESSLIVRGASGNVVHYDEEDGYGFISTTDLDKYSNRDNETVDVFFHISDYLQANVEENDRLEFDVISNDKGFRAINVTPGHREPAEPWDKTFASNRPRWSKDT